MTAPHQIAWSILERESLDLAEILPVVLPADPRGDGSRIRLWLRDPDDPAVVALAFDTATGGLTIEDYADDPATEAMLLALAFRASADDVELLRAGAAYRGALIVERPRTGRFGPMKSALAVVTLTKGQG